MDKIKIEKNVPVPRKFKFQYPWHKMQAGDSFFIEGCTQNQYHSIMTSALGYFNRMRNRIKSQKIEGGRRFWLVEY
jgi:hypothetical protein